MTYRVLILPAAEVQVRSLDTWWTTNRPDSRTSVKAELRRLADQLKTFPKAAPLYRDRPVRYAALGKTPYYAFYEVDDDAREVRVVSVWSVMRESGPPV